MPATSFNFPHIPQPPDWRLDFAALVDAFADVLRALASTPQDPVHHAEGDVLTHLQMVCEALVSLDAWRMLPAEERAIVFAATLFHDVAKPRVTRTEDGRITSPKHALIGSRMARRVLWSHPAIASSLPSIHVREQIAALVRFHGLPLRFVDKPDPVRAVLEASMTARADLLAIVAKADALGRKCASLQDLLDRIELFESFCREQGCFGVPGAFASDHARFVYFARGGDHHYAAYDDTRCTATLMSGLPAAGKDAWCREHAADQPIVSLDALREELDVEAVGDQSQVIAAAKEQAKTHLRAGRDFTWNATNVTRQMRQQLIRLFDAYHARVRIVFLDAPLEQLLVRNRRRAEPVPEHVFEKLQEKMDVPDLTEGHEVEWVGTVRNGL